MRCTVIDGKGAVSLIIPCQALPALVAACCASPTTLAELLELTEPHYQNLKEQVLNGLAIFDEHNAVGNYQAIHRELVRSSPHQQPVFRVGDEVTREASLQPVKAGVVLFNLRAKRIVQLMNSYREIRRTGRARIFDGEGLTSATYSYRLPAEWALVP